MLSPELLPIDPNTDKPIPPRAQPGYYPGFSTIRQQSFWDAATRDVVLKRLGEPPPLRFFTPEEAKLMEAVCARMLPQDDRDDAHRIPIVPGIDERLHEGRGDGYQYTAMPSDQEAYRRGLRGIELVAQAMFQTPFRVLGPRHQDEVLKSLHDGKPKGGEEIWDNLPVHRFWMLLLQDVVEQYYKHPYAWDEIGFGGPAYPRAYMRLENGQPEPWEVQEKRYEWQAPPNSLSGIAELIGGTDEHHATPGQGGTH